MDSERLREYLDEPPTLDDARQRGFGSVAEIEYFDRHGARAHYRTSRLIDDIMDAYCLVDELCDCDEDSCCPVHAWVSQQVERLGSLRAARPRIDRALRLLRSRMK